MDWKYRYFNQEALFQADPAIVHKALGAFAKEWLSDWDVEETPDGLEARSRSAFRKATGRFRIDPAPGGTKVAVRLQVDRAVSLGLMVFDFGHYFDSLTRKWLKGLSWWIQQEQSAADHTEGPSGKAKPDVPPIPKPDPPSDRLMGWVTLLVVLVTSAYAIIALVGLVTGNLYVPGSEGGATIHQLWARILGAIYLVFFVWMIQRLWKVKKRSRGA